MQFAIQARGGWDVVRSGAQWAEERGLAAFALPDHYAVRGDNQDSPSYDRYVHLAAVAAVTETLELVSLVSPVTFRHPAVLHKMGVTLDEVSGGRFSLGVGTGWMDEEFEIFGIDYPPLAERYQMLEECLRYLRAASAPDAVGFQGEHYRLADVGLNPVPESLRLVVGGTGRTKTPRLAGMYADEFNIYSCAPEDYAAKREAAIGSAIQAGRDPSTILFSAASPGLAAPRESDYRRLLESLADLARSTPDRIEEVYDRDGLPHGSGSKPAEMLARLAEAGCERFYAQMFAVDPSDYDLVLEAFEG